MTKIKHRLFAAAGDSPEMRSNRSSPSSSSSSSVSPFAAFLTPAFNACSSPSSDVDPALLRLRHSAPTSSPHRWSAAAAARRQILQLRSSPSSSQSSLSPIGNLRSSSPLYKSPLMVVDMEEDVLVMDGVLVSDSLNSNFRRKNTNNSSGEFDSSVSSNSSGLCKTELCRAWEELGVCRYGTKCQFAHGKEELRFDLRGPRSWKQRTKVVGGSGNNSVPSAGSSTYTNKYHHYNSLLSLTTPDSDITATPEEMTPTKTIEVTPTKTPESPMSSTFSWPPTKEDNAYITKVLYGPSSRPRLPFFEEICPSKTNFQVSD